MVALSTLSTIATDEDLTSGANASASGVNAKLLSRRNLVNNLLTVSRQLESNDASGSAPTDKPEGKIWCDTTTDPALLKFYKDGSENTETVVGLTLTQTLTNKTLTAIAAASTFATGGTATHKAMGVISVNTTAVGNVGAGEDDLMSYTLPANTLDANGKAIRITTWGYTVGTGVANDTIKFYFGSAATVTLYASDYSTATKYWRASIIIVRTGASAQDMLIDFLHEEAPTHVVSHVTDTEDTTGTIGIKFTGQCANSTDNDVTQEGMIIEILN